MRSRTFLYEESDRMDPNHMDPDVRGVAPVTRREGTDSDDAFATG